jgi:hypothetical protein
MSRQERRIFAQIKDFLIHSSSHTSRQSIYRYCITNITDHVTRRDCAVKRRTACYSGWIDKQTTVMSETEFLDSVVWKVLCSIAANRTKNLYKLLNSRLGRFVISQRCINFWVYGHFTMLRDSICSIRKTLNFFNLSRVSMLVLWVLTPCGLVGRHQRFGNPARIVTSNCTKTKAGPSSRTSCKSTTSVSQTMENVQNNIGVILLLRYQMALFVESGWLEWVCWGSRLATCSSFALT